MKSIRLYSLFFLILSPDAHANIGELSKRAQSLQNRVLEKLDFLTNNIQNCTRYHSQIKNQALIPKGQAFRQDRTQFQNAFSGVLNSCSVPSQQNLVVMERAGAAALNRLNTFITDIQNQHSRMMIAMEADPRYPNCKETKAGDKNSTRESLAYQDMKRSLEEYKTVLSQLVDQTRRAQVNRTLASNACSRQRADSNPQILAEKASLRRPRSLSQPDEKKTAELNSGSAL